MSKTQWLTAAAAISLAAGSADAQLNFGTGCPGASGTTPTISATTAVAGSTYTLSGTGPAGAPIVLIAGFSNTLIGGLPLPFDVSFLPAPGCVLLNSADLTFNAAFDGSGDFSANVPSGSAGNTLYWQIFALDADIATLGGFSDGVCVNTLAPAAAGDLVITEIMQNPNFVGDGNGEYVEIYNPGVADVDINGWTLRDDDFDSHIIDNGGPLLVPAGGYLVLGNDADSATNGNITVDYDYSDSNGQFFLANGADEVVLQVGATEVDRVNYDGGPTFPDPTGASMELDASALDATSNDDGANWAASTCTIAGGPVCNDDTGTPGGANDICTTSSCTAGATGEIIITEIMQNPDAVFDSAGEWFEVYNTTGSDIDMNGWTIGLGGGSEVIGVSLVVPAGGYALFAENGDSLTNGGLPTVDYVYSTSLFLGNGSQTVQVLDDTGATSAVVSYDDGATFPDPTGASMTLDPTKLTGAEAEMGANWCEATSAYGDGDLGTPGAANDACPAP